MGRHSSCAGQMTLDFLLYKNQQKESIKYPDVPKVSLLFDEKDAGRVEDFKCNFTGIEYRALYSSKVDYFLVFLSKGSLMNEDFLRIFLDINDEKNNGKIVGFIIDDDLRKMEGRLKLYEYYNKKFIEICDFKKKCGSNADIRLYGEIYERSFEKMGDILGEILRDEKNKKISPEDKFESCLRNDGKNEFRIRRHAEGYNEKSVGEDIYMKTKNEFNNCNIVSAGKCSQISFNEDSENYSVTQKNGIEKDELEIICEAITKDVQSLNEEERKGFQSMVEEIKKEYSDSQNSKENKLTKCLKLIAPMLTIANGTPTLLQNLLSLQSFLISHIT